MASFSISGIREARESFEAMTRRVMENQAAHIEMMAAAYLKATGLPPDRVELVQENQGNKIIWYFRERQPEKIVTMSAIDKFDHTEIE